MEVRFARLAAHLETTLSPIYIIHGDEPLFAIEAGDAIRDAARRAGSEDRELFVVDAGFKWDSLVASSANLGLFGGRKLIDLRLPSGKPGVAGAKALEALAASPNQDHVLVVTMPRADRATQSSVWFAALAGAGVAIAVPPLERGELPQWIAGRLARQGQSVDEESLALLAERFEGNLLAARQEIGKLGLLLPAGRLLRDAVERAVADVARFDILQLSEAWLAGDAARAVRILAALESEGEALPLVVWQLAEDLHALASVFDARAKGTPVATAIRNARVWGRRMDALERAAQRIDRRQLPRLLMALARLDALAKGMGRGSPWDGLRSAALDLAGLRVPAVI